MFIPLSTTSVLVLILSLIPLYWFSKRSRLQLPPGPKGWPLIGNLFDMPTVNFAKTYTEWAQKYGAHPGLLYSCIEVNR
jgi:hypothetical protein